MQQAIEYTVDFDESEVTIEAGELAEIVRSCFLLSLDLRLSEGMRGLLRATGSQLRLQLRDLLDKVFDGGTADLAKANDAIKDLNARLKRAKSALDRVAATVEGLGALTKQLDDLLKIAGMVI